MIKRTFYLGFVTFMMFCIVQSVFAGFSVVIVNRSDIVYKSVDIVITPVGFDASYGRITIDEEIKPGERKNFDYQCKYLSIPFTGTRMPPRAEGCDLNIMVVANPKPDVLSVQTRTYKKILDMLDEAPQMIGEDIQTFPSRPPLRGIQPPNIRIILTSGADGAENINAVFT